MFIRASLFIRQGEKGSKDTVTKLETSHCDFSISLFLIYILAQTSKLFSGVPVSPSHLPLLLIHNQCKYGYIHNINSKQAYSNTDIQALLSEKKGIIPENCFLPGLKGEFKAQQVFTQIPSNACIWILKKKNKEKKKPQSERPHLNQVK